VLDVGCLYAHYSRPPEAKNAVSYVYPLVVQSIHRGWIKGERKIVTAKSGVYGWPGDRDLHLVHFCDARGYMARHSFPTTVDQAGVRTELVLKENETAVLKKVPVAIQSESPINLIVQQYDEKAIRLVLNGSGKTKFTIRNGAFAVRAHAGYLVKADAAKRVTADQRGTLSFGITLDGERQVSIEQAEDR
jgi:hypothetical protein